MNIESDILPESDNAPIGKLPVGTVFVPAPLTDHLFVVLEHNVADLHGYRGTLALGFVGEERSYDPVVLLTSDSPVRPVTDIKVEL